MTNALTYLARNLRDQDAMEVMKSSTLPAKRVLIDGWNASAFRRLYRNPYPVAVVGVVDHGQGRGVPWMLATDEVNYMPATLHRESKRVLQQIQEEYSCLMNVVDADNTTAIEWLEVLGFRIEDPVEYGPYELPFRPFSWSR